MQKLENEIINLTCFFFLETNNSAPICLNKICMLIYFCVYGNGGGCRPAYNFKFLVPAEY